MRHWPWMSLVRRPRSAKPVKKTIQRPADRFSLHAIEIRKLQPAVAAAIHRWPRYEGEFAPLDYALRENGWLDLFPESATTRQLALYAGCALVGFSLLTDISNNRAEFYVAIHPAQTGRGLGQAATRVVLGYAFDQLHLAAVYLKVRGWHQRGLHIYTKAGFLRQGEKSEEIQGRIERFVLMEISAESFRELSRPTGR